MLFKQKLEIDLQNKLTCNENQALNKLVSAFVIHAKKEVYLVGGCVRDLILGRPIHDIDLTTNATPNEMIDLVKTYFGDTVHVIETGLKHGTVTFYFPAYEVSFEVTTYRTDVDYTDHRHPDAVVFSNSLEEDLKRRDLTINSLAYDYLNKEVIMLDDSYLSDLEIGIIRTVGNPEDRFKEDALRMLRAIRFSAQLGFNIHFDTYKAIQKLAPTLINISMERIRDELTKMLLTDHVESLDLVRTTNLFKYMGNLELPFDKLVESKQHNKYHYTDVWHHILDVMRMVPKDFELRWAALFHDFGKLDCESVDDDGWMHYYGHPDFSADRALDCMTKLKFTNKQIEDIYKLVKFHDVDIREVKNSTFKKTVNEIGIDLFPKFLKLRYADAMAHNLSNSCSNSIQALSKAKDRFAKILKDKDALKISDLKINGYDLIKLGYKDAQIGEQLRKLLELVLEDPTLNDHEKLYNLSIKGE